MWAGRGAIHTAIDAGHTNHYEYSTKDGAKIPGSEHTEAVDCDRTGTYMHGAVRETSRCCCSSLTPRGLQLPQPSWSVHSFIIWCFVNYPHLISVPNTFARSRQTRGDRPACSQRC